MSDDEDNGSADTPGDSEIDVIDLSSGPPAKANTRGRPAAAVKAEHFTEVPDSNDGNSRKDFTCNYCTETIAKATKAKCETHLLSKCNMITDEMKQKVRDSLADKAPDVKPATVTRKEMKAGSKRNSSVLAHFQTAKPLPQQQQEELDHLLLHTIIINGFTFRFLDDPYWLKFIDIVSGGRYTSAGKSVAVSSLFAPSCCRSNLLFVAPHMCTSVASGTQKMRTSILPIAFEKVQRDQHAVLAKAKRLTLNADGWSDRNKKSVMAYNYVTEERRVVVAGIEEYNTAHTAVNLKGEQRVTGQFSHHASS